jgi:hypothetical protein
MISPSFDISFCAYNKNFTIKSVYLPLFTYQIYNPPFENDTLFIANGEFTFMNRSQQFMITSQDNSVNIYNGNGDGIPVIKLNGSLLPFTYVFEFVRSDENKHEHDIRMSGHIYSLVESVPTPM